MFKDTLVQQRGKDYHVEPCVPELLPGLRGIVEEGKFL